MGSPTRFRSSLKRCLQHLPDHILHLHIMDPIVGVIDTVYMAAAFAAAVCSMSGAYLYRRMRARASVVETAWAARSLMPTDEAKLILPRIVEAAEGMYVFPRLPAATVFMRSRRGGSKRVAADVDLRDLVLDYVVYTPECELVCVVLVVGPKKATSADALRNQLLRAAGLPVISVRPGQLPERDLLRAHLQLALDQRRVELTCSKGFAPGRLAAA